MTSPQLIDRAVSARQAAYAPYSKFQVGAALLTENGQVFTGCNIENASYGLTICAERVALYKAISEGETAFQSIAICVPGGGTPCGACRQVLNEFAPDLKVLLCDETGRLTEETTLRSLLPNAFGPQNLT